VRAELIPGGLKNNREFVGDCAGFAEDVPEENRALLFDPQTSGGLLIAIAPEAEGEALQRLVARGVKAAGVGRVIGKTAPLLRVI
jgi:selenide, water dikinase